MPALSDDLRDHGERFSYFQAIRLLRRANAEAGATGKDAAIRVRPHLSLGFPQTDIERIAPRPEGGWRITANFLGLYGVASPLPTFYTEDLLDDQREGRHARREFLDVVHHTVHPLFFDAWRKYRLQLRAVEEEDPRALDTLHAFAGLGSQAQRAQLPMADGLLRHLGLFAQRTRSALGLRTLLADAFAPAQVEIESCAPQWQPIPAGQRLRLGEQGHTLGEDSHLGVQIEDHGNLLRIVLRGLPRALFHALLPGQPGHARLQFLTRFYLTRPLDVAVELQLAADECRGARFAERTENDAPSGGWSALGLDTWLGVPAPPTQARVGFHLPASLPAPPTSRSLSHAAG